MVMKSRFPKLLLFILSMAPFFIILGLMAMDIPICFDGDSQFVGWDVLWKNTRVGWAIIALSIIGELIIFCLFNGVCKRVSGEQSERVCSVKNKNFELISFVTSIFLPLISFRYDQLSHWIVMVIVLLIICYIFCTSDGYFTNPTLALFGYRLYEVDLDNMNEGNKMMRNLIILSKSVLDEGDTVRCYKLTDRVSYAKKNNKNNSHKDEKGRSNQ